MREFIALALLSYISLAYGYDCPEANGVFSDPDDCSQFYVCSNGKPFHQACGAGTFFDDVHLVCDREENVDCGDRPKPGTTTTTPTTPPTTTTPFTGPTTTTIPTTTTTGTTTTNPNPTPLPNKVMSLYILITDETIDGYKTPDDWQPILFDWQQTSANVLFFTFIHPTEMRVPVAMKNLAMTRGSSAPGAVPKDTVILFAIGGYAYSQNPNPWPWLVSKAAAEAMAAKVATWPAEYGCDGIDLDIEEGAGSTAESGVNVVHFIKKLRELNKDIIITQPTYGFPQIQAEIDVINASWMKDGTSNDLAAGVGLMVYQGSQALNWVSQFTEGATNPGPISVNVPSKAVLLGCRGAEVAGEIMTMANESVKQDLLGIMVWYASVKNGFLYEAGFDASRAPNSIAAYTQAMELFNKYNH